jgi:hypothetical protein
MVQTFYGMLEKPEPPNSPQETSVNIPEDHADEPAVEIK